MGVSWPTRRSAAMRRRTCVPDSPTPADAAARCLGAGSFTNHRCGNHTRQAGAAPAARPVARPVPRRGRPRQQARIDRAARPHAGRCDGAPCCPPARRMPPASRAEIAAAPGRDSLHRARHALGRDIQESLQQRLGRPASPRGCFRGAANALEGALGRIAVDRDRESLRAQAPQEQVDIGQRERPARAIARGPGVGARALRTDGERAIAERAHGTAARRDRLDPDRGREQHRAADGVLEDHLAACIASPSCRIGAIAAHVERDGGAPMEEAAAAAPDNAGGGPEAGCLWRRTARRPGPPGAP